MTNDFNSKVTEHNNCFKSYIVILSFLTGNGRLRPVTGIHKGINKTYSSKFLKEIFEKEIKYNPGLL